MKCHLVGSKACDRQCEGYGEHQQAKKVSRPLLYWLKAIAKTDEQRCVADGVNVTDEKKGRLIIEAKRSLAVAHRTFTFDRRSPKALAL